MSLQGKTVFITGASRGIGHAIAVRVAREGANVVIAAKSDKPHPKLPGTIHTTAAAVVEAGGQALPVVLDVRDETAIERAVALTLDRFGGIDICVNNASAMYRLPTPDVTPRQFDIMHQINVRGTFLVTRACVPHLLRSSDPHIMVLSPPVDLAPKWFGSHVAYTLSKFGMSMLVLGWAEEFGDSIAVNALWPHTPIATAAIEFNSGGLERMAVCRRPEVMADAAHTVFTQEKGSRTGRFLIDDLVLSEAGVSDFDQYANVPGGALAYDLFVDERTPVPEGVVLS